MHKNDNMAETTQQASHHALSIAGSDSCGGAGIQADIKTINQHGVEVASVLTAITAQNTSGVHQALILQPDIVRAQLRAVLEDVPITAAKTGMLGNIAIIEVIAAELQERSAIQLVIDPVMVASSGARLLDRNAERALASQLLPLACLITPNLPEAAVLTGLAEDASSDALAEKLLQMGARAVLIKGGHGHGEQVEDLLMTTDGCRRFTHLRLPGRVHGTGCALSAAITARLACAESLEAAVEGAIGWLHHRLRHTWMPQSKQLAMLPFAL